jgi:hypothetical protein
MSHARNNGSNNHLSSLVRSSGCMKIKKIVKRYRVGVHTFIDNM